ncbi:MAG: hypothetical protein H6807_13055 [Planctomycetes bacterium]|nr:hypothetical protein [Planctomycetota bacterium]
MNPKRPLLLLIAFALFAPSLSAQVVQDYPGGGDLGYHDSGQPFTEPLVLDDTTVILALQGKHDWADRPAAGLQVLRNLHGLVQVDFVPVPGHLWDFEGIWHKPRRLDATSLIMAGAGADGRYGSFDDELIRVSGLDDPVRAEAKRVTLRVDGPTRDTELHVDGPRRVFYMLGQQDGDSASGPQIIVVADRIGEAGENVQVLEIRTLLGSGGAPYFVNIGTGWIFPLTGVDENFGTADDAFGYLRFDALGNAILSSIAFGLPVHVATSGMWPGANGHDGFIFASPGPDQQIGDDDEILRVSSVSQVPTLRHMTCGGGRYFVGATGNPPVAVDPAGRLFLPQPGLDQTWGGDDDEIHVLTDAGTVVLPALAALRPTGGDALAPVALSDCVTLMAQYGSSPFAFADLGVIVIRFDPQSQTFSATSVPVFEDLRHIVPLDDDTAMLFTALGNSYVLRGLASGQILLLPVGQNVWDGQTTPRRISPSAVATFVYDPADANGVVADLFRMHKVPAWFSYGEATANAAGYDLEVGIGTVQPRIGGQAYQVTLGDAPPSEPAALIVALARDDLLVAPDCHLLVEPESVLWIFNWGTFADGSSAISLMPPSDPLLQGIAGHFQWLVWDQSSPRGFQLSRGLTVSF